MQREKENIVYSTKVPKMRVKDNWQIKLEIIANTNRDTFKNDKEYEAYIEEHTQYAIKEQNARFEKAWAELDKQTASNK